MVGYILNFPSDFRFPEKVLKRQFRDERYGSRLTVSCHHLKLVIHVFENIYYVVLIDLPPNGLLNTRLLDTQASSSKNDFVGIKYNFAQKSIAT